MSGMELTPIIKVGLPIALFMVMLGMGMTLGVADFRRVATQPRAFGLGMGVQFLLLPLLAVILAQLFSLPAELAVGLLVLSFCPSGTTSNLFSYLARADVALSISLTAVASVLTPFTVPLLTRWVLEWQLGAAQPVPFSVLKTMMQLAVVVLIPVVIGMVWKSRAPRGCDRWQPKIHRFSVLLFVAVIVAMVVNLGSRLSEFFALTGMVCVTMILAAMSLGWVAAKLGRLDLAQTKTISIEVGMQHGGMALVVTQGVLANSTMSIVPVMYGLLMLVPILALVASARIYERQRFFAG